MSKRHMREIIADLIALKREYQLLDDTIDTDNEDYQTRKDKLLRELLNLSKAGYEKVKAAHD